MYDLSRVKTTGSSSADELSRSFSSTAVSSVQHDNHDAIMHAMLEDNCLFRALEELNLGRAETGTPLYTRKDPEVIALGRQLYQEMSQGMAQAGITTSNMHSDEKQAVRDEIREAFDSVSRRQLNVLRQGTPALSRTNSALALANQRNRLPSGASRPQIGFSQDNDVGYLPPFLQPYFRHPMIENTLRMGELRLEKPIGKGGYGTVFKAVHSLDGGSYAVKQIPLSPVRIRNIRKRGKAELDALFLEVRTMRNLDHPNIVRYHNAWIEQLTIDTLRQVKNQQRLIEGGTAASSTFESETHESESNDLGQANTGFDVPLRLSNDFADGADNIVFGEDTSVSVSIGASESVRRRMRQRSGSHGTFSSSLSKKSTVHSIGSDEEEDDDEIETIPRNLSDINEQRDLSLSQNIVFEQSSVDDHHTSHEESAEEFLADNTRLVLHIQMALYPLTLAEYISSNPSTSLNDMELHHCFHPKISLNILLAILEGVEYLHAQGVVHRDLKPANIFLSPVIDSYRHKDRVALETCDGCIKAGQKKAYQLGVKIGDFGLVTAIARPEANPQNEPAKAVGTEFYRPPVSTSKPTEKLDIFALGVIALELLWKFDTKMERAEVLQELKKGNLPTSFEDKVGVVGPNLADCIKGMVHRDEKKRSCCSEVQHSLEAILREVEFRETIK